MYPIMHPNMSPNIIPNMSPNMIPNMSPNMLVFGKDMRARESENLYECSRKHEKHWNTHFILFLKF